MGYTLCVLGCGTMGVAILSGVLDSLDTSSRVPGAAKNKYESHTAGTLSPTEAPDACVPNQFIACVNRENSARKLRAKFDALGSLGKTVEVFAAKNASSIERSDVVLLCCKPQFVEGILAQAGVKEALSTKIVISILAGVKVATLESWLLPGTKVIRAMPNTPCKIREGMTAVSSFPDWENVETIIMNIFRPIGRCRVMEEKYFDACTALSGSGPAFACLFLEAMADGGVMMGLPRAEALEFASQTLQGAARMVLQDGAHPAQIKDSVATPSGCTIAGLLTLEDGHVRSTVARGIQVAAERATELGTMAKKK